MAFGIDVSRYQTGVNYQAAKAGGVDFCIVKAGGSETGSAYVATGYQGHVDGARAAGMGVGHYWFNGEGNPVTDGNYLVDHLHDYRPGDALVLDIENEGSMPAWNPGQALAFCQVVQARMGVVPMLYMSSSVTRGGWSPLVNMGAKLWVAEYHRDLQPTNPPTGLGPWGDNWSIWQYSSTGGIPGYSKNIDKNISSVPFDQIFPVVQPEPEPPKPDDSEIVASMYYPS